MVKQLQHSSREQSQHPASHEAVYVYPAQPESVRSARSTLGKTLRGWGLAELADDMLQCLSEAFTNALLHGAPDENVTVRVMHDGRTTRIEVIDSAEGHPQMQTPPEATTGVVPQLVQVATGGRGLLLIEHLSDRWGVDRCAGSKAVWFERTADGPVRDCVKTKP